MHARVSVHAAAIALILGTVGFAGCGGGSTPETASPAPSTSSPPTQSQPPQAPVGLPPSQLATRLPADAIRASLPELPMMPAPRPREYVVAAYEFAALHPEVLKYVPCYCGCERTGHQHNESCFVASRDAEGRVVGWDTHGMG